jgi:predicted RNA binding protein YcfA (HicA-like mRNA interferase family)
MVRQTGPHVRLVKGDKRVTVAMHRFVPVGTIQNVLRQAGLSIEQFVEAL